MCQQAALKNLCQEKCQQEQTFPEMANIHRYTSYNNEFDSSFKNWVLLSCLLILETVCIKFHKKSKYEND